MFQTGYLTIIKQEEMADTIFYQLGWPNREVRQSFHVQLLTHLTHVYSPQRINRMALYRCLEAGKLENLRDIIHAFFSSIPHDWYRNNPMAKYEGYYCSIVYCYFVALGLEIIAEDTTNHGQIDLSVKLGNRIFIMEFKVVEQAGEGKALQQIINKDYASKYVGQGEIWLIGVEFSSENRNIIGFEYNRHSA
ncbi:MAG: PD-(D/E)XK nuclease domain-containing protein, partial [Mariprofundales bacterium]